MRLIEEKLTEYMDSWADAGRFSGAVLVSRQDRILLSRSYGYANQQYEIANTVHTKYKIASYTKPFTAVSILKLYEEGYIKLEDSVHMYIPAYRHGHRVTVHHLLSHTSGIPEHTNFAEYRISEPISFNVIVDRLNTRELDFAAGERADYSNSNYVLLAKIVEIVSGMSIEAFYHKYLFGPAGLEHTAVSRNEDIVAGLAQGYSYSGQGLIHADYYDMSGAYGSGFLYSTVEDLLRWNKALLHHAILAEETLNKMLTPYGHIWYMNAWAGYGCLLNDEYAHELGASGLISGYSFNVWVDRKNEDMVILLGNNDTIAMSRVLEGIKGIVSGIEYSVEIVPIAQGSISSPELLQPMTGKYICKYTGAEFNISSDGANIFVDRLWTQECKGTPFRLQYIEEDRDQLVFACEVCEGKFIFMKREDDRVTEAVYQFDTIKLPYEKVDRE